MGFIYNDALLEIATNGFDPGATWELMLMHGEAGLYTPDRDHHYVADTNPGSTELNTAGYARRALSNFSLTLDRPTNRVGVHFDGETYLSVGTSPYPTVSAGIIYTKVTDDNDSVLFAYIDSISAPTNGSDLAVIFDATGAMRLIGT